MPLSMVKKMLYTFLMMAFPLDLDSLEMEGPWFQAWTKVGKVLAVVGWEGGGVHGDADASNLVPAGGGLYLRRVGGCAATIILILAVR